MHISHETLKKVYIDLGVKRSVINCYDTFFALPTEHWVEKSLGKALKEFLGGDFTFREEQWECNKYAKTASALADWAWYKTDSVDSALAFGMFAFMQSAGIGHMVNTAIHKDNEGELYAAFYEPQPAKWDGSDFMFGGFECLKPIILTKEQIGSCISCLYL